MRLYLDDNSAGGVTARLLQKAGHDVQIPSDVNMTSAKDAKHLTHAIADHRVVLTQDWKDFEDLHELVLAAGGHHPGILVVRNDNNPKRDLDAHGIVRAIANLVAAGVPVADEYIILNAWR